MGLINSIGAWFEKVTGGFTFGTTLFKLTVKGNIEAQSNGNTAEHIFPNRNGTIALLDDWLNMRPYKAYTCKLTQFGISDPTAVILENNLGAIVWTRISAGVYEGVLTGAFPNAYKVLILSGDQDFGAQKNVYIANANTIVVSTATLQSTALGTNVAATPSDGVLTNYSLEVRVYP